jgi:hypothetical protein
LTCQTFCLTLSQQRLSNAVGTRIDKENSHGAANAAQKVLADKPSSSHDLTTKVSHQKEDISFSLHKSGGMSGMGVQASHQYGVAPSPNMAEHAKQSASLQQLQSITSAAEPDANRTSPRLPLKPDAAALQHVHITHESDASLADSVQKAHRAAPPDAQANAILAEATMSDLACLGREKQGLPCPECLPASLLQYDQAWAASVGPFEMSTIFISQATSYHIEPASITQLFSCKMSAVSSLKRSAA